LAGPSLDAINSFCEPVNVAPKESVVDLDGGLLDHAFPPYSVTVLRM
jgi:hypothetical protein